MQDRGLSEFKSFSGYLQASGCNMPITFSARIDQSGEVEFDFGTIALTQETIFIMNYWDDESFSLSGKSSEGVEFKTEDLQFNSLKHGSSKEAGSYMNPAGACTRAEFRRKLLEPAPKPILHLYIKGFQNFPRLSAKCIFGTVIMDGRTSIDDPDIITGRISVYSEDEPTDLSVWRMETDKFLEHLRRVMSFASASMLQAPIIEFHAGDDLEVVALSQNRQAPALMHTFHYLNQQPIFDAAVSSFFIPPFKVNNLFFAIEWFAMDATYNEVRLVNAMTVLENLVAANLADKDAKIRPQKEFDKIRRTLRQVLKKCVDKWSAEKSAKVEEVVADLNERLSDLNRRSMFQKTKILAEHWSVPLDGIGDDRIKAAKRARDLIVHRGHYYEDGKEKIDDLWEHVSVVREIVVRFILTAIGYKGSYYSYLDGYHEAQFPPQADILNTK
jgi:hypothetical protein